MNVYKPIYIKICHSAKPNKSLQFHSNLKFINVSQEHIANNSPIICHLTYHKIKFNKKTVLRPENAFEAKRKRKIGSSTNFGCLEKLLNEKKVDRRDYILWENKNIFPFLFPVPFVFWYPLNALSISFHSCSVRFVWDFSFWNFAFLQNRREIVEFLRKILLIYHKFRLKVWKVFSENVKMKIL